MSIIERGTDGYYHPRTEEELRDLVVHADAMRRRLRVRGSSHSVPAAIYTDGWAGEGVPPGGGMDLMLDQYRAVTITPVPEDPTHAVVEVEAGVNLGKNPYDPTGTSTWKNSLNYMLQEAGYALDDLGGITHQTIAGFLSTGSSGGSLRYSIENNITRIRFIDGTGTIWDVAADDPDEDKRRMFAAVGCSMGLLGVISRVWLRVGPTWNLFGKQTTTPVTGATIDLFGDNPRKISLEAYLQQTPYVRLMWWPQRGFERIQVWQAARMEASPDFTRRPFAELGEEALELASLAGSLFYTILGNLNDISRVPDKLDDWYRYLEGTLDGGEDVNACASPRPRLGQRYTVEDVLEWLRTRFDGSLGRRAALRDDESPESSAAKKLFSAVGRKAQGLISTGLAEVLTELVRLLLAGTLESPAAQALADWLSGQMPTLIDDVIAPFVPDGTVEFWDTWMCGLPMDNQMDDKLWPTEFTELWIPVAKATEAMRALRDFYAGGGDPRVAYEHTGAFSCELYAASPSRFWLSPSHGAAMFRVDVFWFGKNAGSPAETFYPRFWELLQPFGFRAHWGKHLPPATPAWRRYLREHTPRLDDFLALRARLDPHKVFLTDYWRAHLGIEL